MRSQSYLFPVVTLAALTTCVQAQTAPSVDQGILGSMQSFFGQSIYPTRQLHNQFEIGYGQVSDSRDASHADLREYSARLNESASNGLLGLFLGASYANSVHDVVTATSTGTAETASLAVTGITGGVYLEGPISGRFSVFAEYGYHYNKLQFTTPVGSALIPNKDSFGQGFYGARFFLTASDALSYGIRSGQGSYLAPLSQDFAIRHTFNGNGSIQLSYSTGSGVNAWQVGFGVGF
jgi:hypothetical protein